MIEIMIVYALITSAMFYLGSRALITQWLWSRYPPRLAKFADCSACAGTWYGFAVGLADRALGHPSTPEGLLTAWYAPIIVGLCSMTWTPIGAAILQRALDTAGTVIPE